METQNEAKKIAMIDRMKELKISSEQAETNMYLALEGDDAQAMKGSFFSWEAIKTEYEHIRNNVFLMLKLSILEEFNERLNNLYSPITVEDYQDHYSQLAQVAILESKY